MSIKIAIIGYGFVGKATDFGFSKGVKKILIDPKLNTSIKDLEDFDPAFCFVCVPTPMLEDGSQDCRILFEVFEKLLEINYRGTIILKSTVLPDALEKLKSETANFVYNPEFLREKNAEEDFINAPFIILGGKKNCLLKVKNLYRNHSLCKSKNYIQTDIYSASLIKYTINSFLASKVLFFNQIKNIFDTGKTSQTWDEFTEIISIDERIGSSHMNVPGHDGRKGFGGACFTKDTAAFLNYSKSISEEFTLLKTVIEINNKIRSQYEDLDEREKHQNVNYDFDS